MKLLVRDALAILQANYGVDAAVTTHDIKSFHTTNPDGSHSAVSFELSRDTWHILVDNTADDDEDYIRQQLGVRGGELLTNLDSSETVTLYKGKAIYVVRESDTSARLDSLLAARYPEQSRTSWRSHIEAGYVTVDGEVANTASQRVLATAKIVANLPEAPSYQDETLPIIYQDDSIIVVDKPAGILTHAKGPLSEEFTVADFFKRYSSWQADTNRPGIVHRLDRNTSGVIAGALNEAAGKYLQKQFAQRSVKKTYYAVVAGTPAAAEAVIDLPIERNPTKPSQFRVGASGKSATTHYRVIESNDHESLLELKPRTGRTHQLRVHLAYIGHPIKGDTSYGGAKSDRMYLHAHQLELTRPDRVRDTFTSPVPDNFWTASHDQ